MKRVLFLIAFLVCGVAGFGQITGPASVCPGVSVSYEFSGSNGCTFAWSVVGGTISGATNGTSINVTWNSTVNSGIVYLTHYTVVGSTCSSTTYTATQKDVAIKTLTPITGTIDGEVACGFRGNKTFYAPFAGADPNKPDAYVWSTTTGWSVVSQSTNSITYNVTNDNAGNIQVYGTRSGCSNVTPTRTVTVTRSSGAISKSGSETFLGFCPSAVDNTATINSSNTGKTYTWTTTNGYTINGSASPVTTSSKSVTINSTSSTEGTLTVVENGTCAAANSISWDLKYASAAPVITPEYYETYGTYSGYNIYYSISPYYTVPNNPVYNDGGYSTNLTAYFSITGATSVLPEVIDYNYPEGQTGSRTFGPTGAYVSSTLYNPDEWVVWRISATNGCGTTTFNAAFYLTAAPGMFALAPNPTSDELTVSFLEKRTGSFNMSKSVKKKDFSAKLLDGNGRIVRQSSTVENNKIKLNTRDIPEGTYFIHIVDGKEVIKKQVIIKH